MGHTDETYNGWTNYETWAVALWLGNDEGDYSYWRGVTRETLESAPDGARHNRGAKTIDPELSRQLAERLEAEVLDNSPLNDQNSLYSDLLNSSLSLVNWDEIAAQWLLEMAE